MTGVWLAGAILTFVALAFLVIPWWRERKTSSEAVGISGPIVALMIAPVAFALYLTVTTFDPNIEPVASHDELALLDQLAAKLEENPGDVEGWKLLGRSYRELGDYQRARMAFEQAWARTESPDDTLKINYAESMLFTEPATAVGAAGDLVEEVLAASPGNQRAIFWGALVASERGDTVVAAERWSVLLASNPPPEIAEIARAQRDLLLAQSGGRVAAAQAPTTGPVIDLDISLGEDMPPVENLGPNAFLFVFARASGGGPPIAARRLPVSTLPGHVQLSDADAAMGGLQRQTLADSESVTVVARISVNGVANEQPGDLYGEAEVVPSAGETVKITIDKVVPPA
jgi:cytochrome c-type biogenesis protein CcmH